MTSIFPTMGQSLPPSHAGSAQTGSEPRVRVPLARPACTHTVMDRVYGSFTCQVCQRLPSLGFVYFCQQDLINGSLTELTPSAPESNLLTDFPSISPVSKTKRNKLKMESGEGTDHMSSLIAQMEKLGFNKSVVKAVKDGHYTPDQIEILKAQKMNVKKTIQKSLEDREVLRSKSGPSPTLLADKLTALSTVASKQPKVPTVQKITALSLDERIMIDSSKIMKVKSNQDKSLPVVPQTGPSPSNPSLSKAFQSCEFRVCHTCRPLFRDRCFASLESVDVNGVQPPSKWIPQLMPVAPASIMKTIGLKEPSGLTSKQSDLSKRSSSSIFDISAYDSDTEGRLTPKSLNPRISVVEDLMRDTKRDSATEDHKSLLQIQKYDSDSSLNLSLPSEQQFEISDKDQNTASKELMANLAQGDQQNDQSLTPVTVKHQTSTAGFNATLVKDMRDIIERANREVNHQYSRHANFSKNQTHRDQMTGLDAHTLERLAAIYRKQDPNTVFDLDLWKALSDSIHLYASCRPLPGKDGADGLDQEVPKVNGLGIMLDGRRSVFIEDIDETGERDGNQSEDSSKNVVGLALTEEAAENHSPDIITSIEFGTG